LSFHKTSLDKAGLYICLYNIHSPNLCDAPLIRCRVGVRYKPAPVRKYTISSIYYNFFLYYLLWSNVGYTRRLLDYRLAYLAMTSWALTDSDTYLKLAGLLERDNPAALLWWNFIEWEFHGVRPSRRVSLLRVGCRREDLLSKASSLSKAFIIGG